MRAGGRNQPFYNVLEDPADGGTMKYVAQENIEVLHNAGADDTALAAFMVQHPQAGLLLALCPSLCRRC